MIAAWMIYCALCALVLAAAATLAERVLLDARGPVRAVWFAAVILSLGIPAVALRNASRAVQPPAAPANVLAAARSASALETTTTIDKTNKETSTNTTNRTDISSASRSIVSSSSRYPALLASMTTARVRLSSLFGQADRPLEYLWLALSSLLGLYFIGGMSALALMRRSWRRDVVLDVPVFVSGRTGPALVGMISPAIVVPEWALAMETAQLALMLRHEQEHRRARDSQLLTLAHVALVVMPWNVALWWQIRRLRAAVELDCDARVLQHVDVRSYGDLLLEVVRPGHQIRLMGATAFAERATQLERRIRVMAVRRRTAANAARAIAASIALLAVSVAWMTPRPAATPVLSLVTPRIVSAPRETPVKSLSRAPTTSLDASARATSRDIAPRAAAVISTPHTEPISSVAELSAADVSSLLRYGTFGIINPMLPLLRNAESLGLTARQADSIATMNRTYMVQLSGIWSPVIQHYAAATYVPLTPAASATRATQASMKALISLAPRINALLTDDQQRRMPGDIAADLDVSRLAAIGAGRAEAGSVFAPNGGMGTGPGGRGRVGGPGR
ncbi:MAG TPA: M56 family metallopeptidase [Gemmatimonadaceae bacterium]|jgi:beta-lactamase regulating signal transducer with metallopeptidase domain